MSRQRPNWDQYFLNVAQVVASMATCDRKLVGSVIVVNKMIVSTGFNGAPKGMPHCDQVGHELVDMGGRQSCIRTLHAEENAIIQAARVGTKIEGGTIYTTASPCYDCMKRIINAGLIRIVSMEFYASRYGKSGDGDKLAKDAGIEWVNLGEK